MAYEGSARCSGAPPTAGVRSYAARRSSVAVVGRALTKGWAALTAPARTPSSSTETKVRTAVPPAPGRRRWRIRGRRDISWVPSLLMVGGSVGRDAEVVAEHHVIDRRAEHLPIVALQQDLDLGIVGQVVGLGQDYGGPQRAHPIRYLSVGPEQHLVVVDRCGWKENGQVGEKVRPGVGGPDHRPGAAEPVRQQPFRGGRVGRGAEVELGLPLAPGMAAGGGLPGAGVVRLQVAVAVAAQARRGGDPV